MGMSHSVEQSSPAVETVESVEPIEVENPEPEEETEEQVHESFDWFLSWI
jgi:hypothetical protein